MVYTVNVTILNHCPCVNGVSIIQSICHGDSEFYIHSSLCCYLLSIALNFASAMRHSICHTICLPIIVIMQNIQEAIVLYSITELRVSAMVGNTIKNQG